MADMRQASSLPTRSADWIFFSVLNSYRVGKTAYLHYDASGKAKARKIRLSVDIHSSSQQSLIHEEVNKRCALFGVFAASLLEAEQRRNSICSQQDTAHQNLTPIERVDMLRSTPALKSQRT